MTNLAAAFADADSARFQSCGTEIGLACAGYAGAVSPLTSFSIASLPGTGRRQDAVLGSMKGNGVAAPRVSVGVAGGMAGDLCPQA